MWWWWWWLWRLTIEWAGVGGVQVGNRDRSLYFAE